MYFNLMQANLFGNILDSFQFIICVCYPIWRSYKVVEAKKFDSELIRWLVYWLIYSSVSKIEDLFVYLLSFFISRLPGHMFYVLMRILFFSWLMHPTYQGALLIYFKWLEPTFVEKKKYFED